MAWTNRVQPSTSWNTGRESIGDQRLTQSGEIRLTQGLFDRITQAVSWAVRSAVSTIWTPRT